MRQREFWARLKRNRMAMTGLALVLGLFVVSVCAPWLAPYDPLSINLKEVLMPPSPAHYLGTDTLGRDVLSRIIYGSRVSLKVGFVAVGLATLIGLLIGALAGYYGGWVDSALMRLVDLMLCFPAFFLILAVIAVLEPSIWNIMAVIGLTSWMGVARLVRAEFLSLREREFVTAARALGAGDTRLILPPHAAQRPGAGDGLRHPGGGRGHPDRERPEFPGARGPAPHPQLGQHPHRRQGQHRDRLVAFGVSRARHSGHGDELQPVGRRHPGGHRPPLEGINSPCRQASGVPARDLAGAASPIRRLAWGELGMESPIITAIVSRKHLEDRKNMIINEIWSVIPQNILTISRESLMLCEQGGTTLSSRHHHPKGGRI